LPFINENQRGRYYKLKQGVVLNISKFETLEDYNNFCESKDYVDPIMENRLRTLDIHSDDYDNWLTGFITGEGNFNIKKIKTKTKTSLTRVPSGSRVPISSMNLI